MTSPSSSPADFGSVESKDSLNRSTEVRRPSEYFEEYIGENMFALLAFHTNHIFVKHCWRSPQTTAPEVKRLLGACIASSCFGYLRIRMAWAAKTRILLVSRPMPWDRYFHLRTLLKLVDDEALSTAEKVKDRFLKVRPLL